MADVKGINPIVNDLGHHLIQGVSTPWDYIVHLDFHPIALRIIVLPLHLLNSYLANLFFAIDCTRYLYNN